MDLPLHPSLRERCRDLSWEKATYLQRSVFEKLTEANSLSVQLNGKRNGRKGAIVLPIINRFLLSRQKEKFSTYVISSRGIDEICNLFSFLGGPDLLCLKLSRDGYDLPRKHILSGNAKKHAHVVVVCPSAVEKYKNLLKKRCEFVVLADVAALCDDENFDRIYPDLQKWIKEGTQTLVFTSGGKEHMIFPKVDKKFETIESQRELAKAVIQRHYLLEFFAKPFGLLFALEQFSSPEEHVFIFANRANVSILSRFLTEKGYKVLDIDWNMHHALQSIATFLRENKRSRTIFICHDDGQRLIFPTSNLVIIYDLPFAKKIADIFYERWLARVAISGGNLLVFVDILERDVFYKILENRLTIDSTNELTEWIVACPDALEHMETVTGIMDAMKTDLNTKIADLGLVDRSFVKLAYDQPYSLRQRDWSKNDMMPLKMCPRGSE